MKLGVFNNMFGKYSALETAQKMQALGLNAIQLWLQFGGVQLSSADLDEDYCEELKAVFAEHGIEIVALCGYQNLATPNPEKRAAAVQELKNLIAYCPALGCRYIVTETGSAHPDSGWQDHPDNYKDETWQQLAQTLKELCAYADEHGVEICIEPHFAQMTKSPETLRRMLDMVQAKNLKLAYDPANLIDETKADDADGILTRLFELTGDSLALLHAKDTAIKNGKPVFVPAGKGVLNYPLYAQLAKKQGYSGPMILEYVSEDGLPEAIRVVKEAFDI